jgi:hypothetical protein
VGRDWAKVSGIPALSGLIVQDQDACDFSASSSRLAIVTASDLLTENLPIHRRLLASGGTCRSRLRRARVVGKRRLRRVIHSDAVIRGQNTLVRDKTNCRYVH